MTKQFIFEVTSVQHSLCDLHILTELNQLVYILAFANKNTQKRLFKGPACVSNQCVSGQPFSITARDRQV